MLDLLPFYFLQLDEWVFSPTLFLLVNASYCPKNMGLGEKMRVNTGQKKKTYEQSLKWGEYVR